MFDFEMSYNYKIENFIYQYKTHHLRAKIFRIKRLYNVETYIYVSHYLKYLENNFNFCSKYKLKIKF